MKRPILINAIAVISALQFIGCTPAIAQDGVNPHHRIHAGVSDNLLALRWDDVGYTRREPPHRHERHRPDHHEREHKRRHHHRHHERKRPVRQKVTGVAIDRQERVEQRVEVRRSDEQKDPRPDRD